MNQLEQQVASLIDIIRLDDDSLENAKAQLVQMANTENKSDLVSAIETQKRREILLVQWELEEVLNTLNPPKEDVVEVVDDPSKRQLRMSELELVHQDPRGVMLYRSKVDDRWVVVQVDPYTRQMVRNEITAEQGQNIFQQLTNPFGAM